MGVPRCVQKSHGRSKRAQNKLDPTKTELYVDVVASTAPTRRRVDGVDATSCR